MEKSIKTALKPYINKTIILSVSGGVDSLVLFHILKKHNFNLVVVHFNHQKRKQSLKEKTYIQNLCANLAVAFEYFALFIDEKENFQDAAHKLRKKHLKEVANKYNTNIIITAHHLNDLAESVLMRLSRGSNLLGYSGISFKYFKDGFLFLKPLLYTEKDKIINYADENKIKYFKDYTNQLDAYTRNRFRNYIIPQLIEENPQFLTKIIQYNQMLNESFAFIRSQTQLFLNDKTSFLISNFQNLDKAVQKDVISYLLEKLKIPITTTKIQAIISFLLTAGPNQTFDLTKDKQVIKVYNKAYFKKKETPNFFKQQLHLDGLNILPNNTFVLFDNNFGEKTNNKVILCYNKLALPLFARTRQEGDILYFSYGHKKLKDYYIDKKIPKAQRNSDIIIADNNNQILAILGKYYNKNPNLKEQITMTFRKG